MFISPSIFLIICGKSNIMTLYINCESISKSHGSQKLFSDISLSIFKGDHLGLIGPNGSGKSTLLKILAGIEKSDVGTVAPQRFLRIGFIPQESCFPPNTVNEIIMQALDEAKSTEHEKQVATSILLGKMGFENPNQKATELSGGWKKRLEIAKQLAKEPDLLLLDEPTNHLDLEGVLWLEKFLLRQMFTYIVISHDRYFLENITNRMMELNPSFPKGMFITDSTYSTFLERRDEFLRGQVEYEKSLASKVRREIEWLKQTPKARTTKSRSRIQEAGELIKEFADVKSRNVQSSAKIDFSSTARQTQKLLAAKNIAKSFEGRSLFSGIDLVLTPGTRLGIIGSNGTGKTTLLKILAGQMSADQGTIKYADGVKVLLFDQHREELPQNLTLRRALAPENDKVNYRGQSIHVNSWCRKFLFSPDRLDFPVSYLSGGEKARVLIARLMVQPADILLLDEPTNDLDIATLETLEESLQEFSGAIVLITHDRYMLEQICNVMLGLAPGGKSALLADYTQWEELQKQTASPQKLAEPRKDSRQPTQTVRSAKLNYNEKRELEQIEKKIELAEEQVTQLQKKIEDPKIASIANTLQEACKELQQAQQILEVLYQRWQELENKLTP
jgi:ABC transport system ATP-binding/permease protein